MNQPKIQKYLLLGSSKQQQQQHNLRIVDDKKHDPIEMNWAIVNQQIVHADQFDKTQNLVPRCVLCNSNLVHRMSHKRHRNGIPFRVRSHFAHTAHTSVKDIQHSNESVEHKVAKMIIKTNHNQIQYEIKCVDCQTTIELQFDRDGKILEECSFSCDDKQEKQYRADLGVFNHSNNLTGVIEVYKTNRIDTIKAKTMTKMDLAWCEVHATDVLALNLTNHPIKLRVISCADKNPRCCDCQDKKALEKKKAEQLAVMKDAEHKRRMKHFINHMDLVRIQKVNEWTRICEDLANAIQENNPNVTADLVDDLLDHPEGILTFGKHAGQHIEHLWNNDATRGYVRWLAGYTGQCVNGKYPETNDSLTKNNTPAFQRIARDLLTGHCLLCYTEVDQTWQKWCRSCWNQVNKYLE